MAQKKASAPPNRSRAKALPHRVYPRGDQGTLVYAPDIAVYVATDNYGIVDLSPFITSATIQRNVNAPSTFMCSFDDKFSRYDRVLRRMDRIVVFLKRVQWVQAFAGYISLAPWETVVPGDAQLMADCTLKRLVYTYWDSHSVEAQQLFPKADVASATTSDSGSAATMFRLLTTIAGWPQDQIQVQKIPEVWLAQAVQVLRKTRDEQINDPETQTLIKALLNLLGEKGDGWLNYQLGNSGTTIGNALGDFGHPGSGSSAGGGLMNPSGIDQEWRQLVGNKKAPLYPPHFGTHPEFYSGFVRQSQLAFSEVFTTANKAIYLRPDAAASLKALSGRQSLSINAGYISYDDQKLAITRAMRANNQRPQVACARIPCPAGISEHGWGTAIDFTDGQSPPESVMNDFGWINMPEVSTARTTNPNHWVFVGNYTKGYPAYVRNSDKPIPNRHQTLQGGSPFTNTQGQFDWQRWNGQGANADTSSNAFKTTYFWPGVETESEMLTGKRAWINDTPLIESIADMASACLRDFQSGPSGDFIAFFPDRLGIYGKFPAMQVRDIEVTDFKMIIQDKTLVTHYVSVADMTTPEPHTGIDLDVLINAGYVTVEQPEVMGLMLGLPPGKSPVGLGKWIMDRFGIRPRRDDNYDIWNPGFNYMIALHRFQEAWASQWNVIAGFTFLPEIFPGMRIELVNYNIGVYVEQVVHSISRTGGFTTTATVSTPMTKKNGEWKLLSMEFDPAQFQSSDAFTDENDATRSTPTGQAGGHPVS